MTQNFGLYAENFHDDSPLSSNGFDALSDHIVKLFESMNNLIVLIDTRLQHEDITLKANGKISKIYTRSNSEPFIKAMCETFEMESALMQKFCDDLRKNYLDPFKEVLRSSYETWRKYKNDCIFSLKNRRMAYDVAVKSCKAYTLKYRTHEQTIRKYASVEQDEKIQNKILKGHRSLKDTEIHASASVSSLESALKEWHETFVEFCVKSETIDRTMQLEASRLLDGYNQSHLTFSTDLRAIMSKLSALGPDVDWETYSSKVIAEKGTHKVFMAYAVIVEQGDGEKTEFSLKFSTTSSTEKIQKISSSQTTKSLGSRVRNSDFYTPIDNTSIDSVPLPPPQCDSTRESKIENKIYEALYDYTASSRDEISFIKGTTITVIGFEDEEWYIGKLPDGTTGAFPINHCAIKKN